MIRYNQAAYYSATMTYLNAVKAIGTTDADNVMAGTAQDQGRRHVHQRRLHPTRRAARSTRCS